MNNIIINKQFLVSNSGTQQIPNIIKYLPTDYLNIIPDNISQNESAFYNFALLFRLPKIETQNHKIKLELNENLGNFKWNPQDINAIINRIKHNIYNLRNSKLIVKELQASVAWRMIIGLGTPHPQETSMNLHHIYGIPYIPASAIKGITRHYFIFELFYQIFDNKNDVDINQIVCLEKFLENAKFNDDYNLSKQEFKRKFKVDQIEPYEKLYINIQNNQKKFLDFQRIFGTQLSKGEVIFFDAFPVNTINLKLDIINPHYPKYYSGQEKPVDYQKPTPIKFLTVENTQFKFFIASKYSELASSVEEKLKEALKNHGIGAKTSLGYGIFNF